MCSPTNVATVDGAVNIRVGKNVFINQCCHRMDIGGINIGNALLDLGDGAVACDHPRLFLTASLELELPSCSRRKPAAARCPGS